VTDPELAQRLLEEEQERESLKERLEREHEELLHELRALIPGAQVLFGFLLAIRFTNQFDELDDTQRYVYYIALLATATALVCFMAPAAYHRLRFRTGDKEYMLQKGNREAIAGTVAIGLAFSAVLFLVTDFVFDTPQAALAALVLFTVIVWRWWAVAVYRAWQDGREARSHDRR
jgi:VIT1/CCC1 family predicted Fe2+/Mn2+ transporter